MNKSAGSSPRCIIIAGPNGAGKTTFAREFLSKEAGVVHFINPDLIASDSLRCDRNSRRWPRAAYFCVNWTGSRQPDKISPLRAR
jgi:predicted ABC-type ATPase